MAVFIAMKIAYSAGNIMALAAVTLSLFWIVRCQPHHDLFWQSGFAQVVQHAFQI